MIGESLARGSSRRALLVSLVACASISRAAIAVQGETTTYTSPDGVEERCVILAPMPGAVYSAADRTEEQAYCNIDFYAGGHALCPKVFSTSPGTLVYTLTGSADTERVAAFEAEQCELASPHKRGANGMPLSYKMTMNDRNTSATFSTAALLYYHFSRYLDAHIHVPVAVWRSMDKDAHRARVSERGFSISKQRGSSAMNHAGWRILRTAESEPSRYGSIDELFSADRRQVYGVLLEPHGDRYGAEFNGTRRSGWGAGQNRDFQETAPFRALRAEHPLPEAIDQGLHEAANDPALRHAMPHGVAPEQMVYWMQELTEITLLDFIFSQQDRVGNIDYLTWWYWVEDGAVRRRPASGTQVPDDLAERHPLRLRRTELNDNDAGGRVPYANFAKQTEMLEKIRHYSPDTYRRLVRLDRDFQHEGERYAYVRDTFGLSAAQLRQVVSNTHLATEILQATCRRGALRFDLDPQAFLVNGKHEVVQVDCDEP